MVWKYILYAIQEKECIISRPLYKKPTFFPPSIMIVYFTRLCNNDNREKLQLFYGWPKERMFKDGICRGSLKRFYRQHGSDEGFHEYVFYEEKWREAWLVWWSTSTVHNIVNIWEICLQWTWMKLLNELQYIVYLLKSGASNWNECQRF